MKISPSKIHNLRGQFQLLWHLCKRDYAVQFAGSALGLSWMFIQSLTLILLYLFVFWGLKLETGNSQNVLPHILTGITFWLPIQEYIQRGTVILTENRQLIKRTGLGISIFLKIPFLQMFLHFLVLFIPCMFYLFFKGELNFALFILALFFIPFSGFFLYPIISYLARANALLKDISPIVRLLLQIGFWSTPILYIPSERIAEILKYNPISYLLGIYRFIMLKNYPFPESHEALLFSIPVLGFLYYASAKKLNKLVLDQL